MVQLMLVPLIFETEPSSKLNVPHSGCPMSGYYSSPLTIFGRRQQNVVVSDWEMVGRAALHKIQQDWKSNRKRARHACDLCFKKRAPIFF
jgi:hypothetical protein